MKQNEYLRQQAEVIPDMPEHFVQHVDLILDKIIAEEKAEAAPKSNTVPFMGRLISKRAMVVLIALMVMLMSLTAYALTKWGIFEQLSDIVGNTTSPEAEELMQSNLHTGTINGVEITVTEAIYDGRTLMLQYSYKFPGVADAWAEQLPTDAADIMSQYGVDWWTDEFWINGQSVCMPSGSGSVDTGSAVPGELIHTEYWRLDNENIVMNGKAEITLPIGRKADGGYTFTFDTQHVQQQVVTVDQQHSVRLNTFSATITEATFTPLMTYITLVYEDDNVAEVYNEEGVWWPFGTDNECLTWIYALQLVSQDGKPVYDKPYGADSVSATEVKFYLPYIGETFDELWLAPVNEGAADMSQAIRVR